MSRLNVDQRQQSKQQTLVRGWHVPLGGLRHLRGVGEAFCGIFVSAEALCHGDKC